MGWLFLTVAGVGVTAGLSLVLVVAAQGWAGGYLWALARRGAASAPEVVGAGLALGSVASVVCGVAAMAAFDWHFGWLVPAVVAFAVWAARLVAGRRRAHPEPSARADLDTPLWWGVAAAIGLGVLSLAPNLRSYPLTWTGTWSGYHGDMLFFESLATSMARLGPLDSIFTPDALIRYHWLAYAWAGQVTEATGAAPFVVLTRVLPFVAVVGGGLLAASWARRLSSVAWVPAFAVVLLVTGGYLGASYGAVYNFDSPSQAMSVLWLLAFTIAVIEFVRGGGRSLAVVLGLLALALAGGKISAAAVAVAAVLWLAFVALVLRLEWARRAVAAAGITVVSGLVGYVVVVAGSADPGGLNLVSIVDRASSIQGMNPFAGRLGIVAGTLILVIAIGARWAGVLWLARSAPRRREPDMVLAFGYMIAAVGTVLVLSGGMNDTWFALAASVPLTVMSAAGAGDAWQAVGTRRRPVLAWAVVAAVVIFGIVFALWATGPSGGNVFVSTLRWAAPLAGVLGALIAGIVIARVFGNGHGSRSGSRSWIAAFVLVLVFVTALARFLALQPRAAGEAAPMSDYAFSPVSSFTNAIDVNRVYGWSDAQVAAAEIVRELSSPADLVATNVTFSPLVPALTGQPTWVAGIAYQAPYGRPGGVPVLLEREAQVWEFINEPSAASAAPLCAAGVEWVWVDPARTAVRTWSPFAVPVLEREDVILARMETCN